VSLVVQSFVPSLPGAEPVGFAMGTETKTGGTNPLGAFGAILDALVKDIPVVGPLLAEAIPDGETPAAMIEPLLAAVAPEVGAHLEVLTEQPADMKQLAADLGGLLAEIQAAFDAGKDPDPALLEQLDAALAALGLAETPPAPAAPTTEAAADNPLDHLGAVLNRIVQRFTDNGKDVPTKLAEIATALTNPTLAPAIAAKLGVEAGAAIAAELAKLSPEAPKPTPAAQQFALPALKAPVILAPEEKPAKAPPRAEAADPEIRLKPAAQPDTPRPVDPAPKTPPAVAQTTHQPEPQQQQQQTQSPQLLAIHTAPATIRAIHAAYQTQSMPQQINIPQLAFDIVRHVQAGQSRFEIRLDPPELGRIDVKLDIDTGGAINARLTVERSETLDLLQRDQRQLERALQQAGLDAGKTSLEFSLKQQNPFDRQQGQPQPTWHASGDEPASKGEVPALPVHLYRATVSPGGVNIFV
jgi:flagellar hook-length control protein FliK